jgi:hypothetical protein
MSDQKFEDNVLNATETEYEPQEPFTSVCAEGESQETAEKEFSQKSESEMFEISEDAILVTAAVDSAEVFIQAGHLNTPDGRTGASGPLGREIDWTPIVTNEAERILRATGVSVIKQDASIKHTN